MDMRKRNESGKVLLMNEVTVNFDILRSFMKNGVLAMWMTAEL